MEADEGHACGLELHVYLIGLLHDFIHSFPVLPILCFLLPLCLKDEVRPRRLGAYSSSWSHKWMVLGSVALPFAIREFSKISVMLDEDGREGPEQCLFALMFFFVAHVHAQGLHPLETIASLRSGIWQVARLSLKPLKQSKFTLKIEVELELDFIPAKLPSWVPTGICQPRLKLSLTGHVSTVRAVAISDRHGLNYTWAKDHLYNWRLATRFRYCL